MTTKPKRVIAYLRVSTVEQVVETQELAIRRYCEAQGWTLGEVYADEGVSGAIDHRPALDRLKADVIKGKVDTLVVFKFDRLARSVSHLLQCLDLFRKHHVDFVSVSEGVDTSTSVGRMVYVFLSGIAEFERSLIKERTVAGLERARSKGKRLGRPRRGFDYSTAVDMRKQGMGFKQIADALKVPRTTVFRCLSSTAIPKTPS